MRRAVRFVFALILGLGLLTWAGSVVVHRATREWFDKDVKLRAQLAVNGARRGLVANWDRQHLTELASLLSDIAHDERIMAAAACAPDSGFLARTRDFPPELSGESLVAHLRERPEAPASEWQTWNSVVELPGGNVHVSAIPLVESERALGYVVLVHDLSFVERREAQTQRFLLLAFGFLALAASAITVVAARLSWRGWSNELRRILRSGGHRPEFQPILRDVHELVDRIAAEGDAEREGGMWTPQRLKQTLNRHLHGERVVVLANREPYVHQRASDGAISVMHPASGLVTALEPVMRACSGTWIAHGSGSADRETADRQGRLRVPPGEESY